MSNCWNTTTGLLFHYETFKIVDIRNKKVGALFRCIQLIIFSYAMFAIVYKKGYQRKDVAISTVSTKVKGIAFLDFHNFSALFNGVQIFDSSDYVIPSEETDNFFVMTNMIVTPNQTQGKCPEDIKFEDNWCSTHRECEPVLTVVRNGNGIRTGACVHSDRHPSIKVCEIYGWCPTENPMLPMPGYNFSSSVPMLDLAKDFTVLVKNEIRFPKFNVRRRNIIGRNDTKYLSNCTYSKNTDNRCPIFKLGDIIDYCGDKFRDVAYRGATYGIIINWDCDFDYSIEKCIPTYDFRRLDDPNAPVSPGYNFRFSQYYVTDDKRFRILVKAYGLKFQILVNGKAGKFSPQPLFLELGSAIALFAICTWICDLVVLYCIQKRETYALYKYERVEDETNCEDDDLTNVGLIPK